MGRAASGLVLLSFFASLAPLARAGDAEAGGAIEGVVVDGESGAPVPGAVVTAEPRGMTERRGSLRAGGPLATATTDDAGRFRLERVARTDLVALRARAPGFAVGEVVLPDEDGAAVASVRIPLDRAGALIGRVVGPDGGEAVVGAHVYAVSANAPETLRDMPDGIVLAKGADGVARGWQALRATSGADGTYRIEGLRLGEPHVVMARRPGYGPTEWSEPVTARRDESVASLDLRLFASASLVVTVRTPSGEPVEGAWVYVGRRLADRARTDARGEARLVDLPPGRRGVAVSAQDHLDVATEIDVAEGALDVPCHVVLSRGVVLEGVVVDDRGEPVPGAKVTARRPSGGSEFRRLPGSSASGETDATGAFRLLALRDGTHDLQVEADGHETVEQRLALPVPALRLVAGRYSTIVGRLVVPKNASPPEGIEASYDARDRAAYGWPDVTVEGTTVRLGKVGGGRIHLVLYARGFAPLARDLSAPPGGEADLGDLPLTTGFDMKGRVLDRGGKPIAGAKVSTWRSDASAPQELRTDADGGYRFDHLAEGTFFVDVEAAEHLEDSAEVVARPGAAFPEFALARGGLLNGVVVHADGTPLDGHVGIRVLESTPSDPPSLAESLYTKDDGTFAVRLRAGTYVVEVRDAIEESSVLAVVRDAVLVEAGATALRIRLGAK